MESLYLLGPLTQDWLVQQDAIRLMSTSSLARQHYLSSERGKHITNTKKKMNSVKHQITICESLQVSPDKDEEDVRLEEKRREFEISLSRSLSNHKVPFQFLECLRDQLKKYCGDS